MKIIGNIAEILFGVYTKDRQSEGEVRYVQIGDFDDEGLLTNSQEPVFVATADINPERQLLQSGDVLLPSKGWRNTAFYIEDSYLPAVAASLFFVIRLQSPAWDARFLTIYLNQPSTQAQIKAMISTTATVPVLNKKDFLNLPVPIIPLTEQHKIIRLHQLHQQERQLTLQLLTQKEQLFQGIFTQIITQKHV